MRYLGARIAWSLNRIVKLFGNLLSAVVRSRVSVKRGRVLCWAYNYKQYGCNPRYLTEYILEHCPEMEVVWAFRKGFDTSAVDKRIKCVRFRTWEYLKAVNSAEFLITNSRTDPWHIYWHKRPEQKYLMLWHGGVALKKIERDAADKLGFSYQRKAKKDSAIADLMISGCRQQTSLLRSSFWYDGEILEEGVPRNDIFFDKAKHAILREHIIQEYNIPQENSIVIYAPTFRRGGSIEPYRINWSEVLPHLRKMLGDKPVTLLLRLHPNLIGKADTSSLMTDSAIIDMTRYPDMQELLCISDMLITDYSSSMFDMGMLGRPCMLYATDVEKYDRGYYFDFADLPFPLVRNEEQLIATILAFDRKSYDENLKLFFDERIGLKEHGAASEAIARWMQRRMIG